MLYLFISTEASDNCKGVMIITNTQERAKKLVTNKFIKWGYKGTPILAV